MPTFNMVMRKIRGGRPRSGVVGTTITLTFVSSVLDSEGGVSATAASTSASQQFRFTEVVPRTGLPEDLEISESSTLKLVVTYPSDYEGTAYTYRDTAGLDHGGTFPTGGGSVSY